MKKYISTGFMILLPVALTLWLLSYLLEVFTRPIYSLIQSTIVWLETTQNITFLHSDTLVVFLSRITALLLTFLLILALGFLARRFFFHSFFAFANRLMAKIPVVGAIYRLTKDITQAMFNPGQKAFKETVLIPFPSEHTHAIGFVTGGIPEKIKTSLPEADVTVFVPTAPHPISGYILFSSKAPLKTIPVTPEETFTFLFSCGVTELKGKKEETPPHDPQ